MKAIVALLLLLTLACIQTSAQVPAGLKSVEKGKAEKMIKKYDGWFKNQKKTDALTIKAEDLKKIMESFPGKEVKLVLARYLGEDGIIDGKKRRVTLLLYVPGDSITTTQDGTTVDGTFYDLASDGSLCPPPYGSCLTSKL